MIAPTAVLVVVDMQNGFISEHSAFIVPVVVSLVDRWRRAGGDLVFTRYINYPDSPFERLIKWTRVRTAPQTDIVAELRPYADRSAVVDKTIYSLFSEESTSLIDRQGWTDLYFCGIATEGCVLKSAVDAFERNLTPWVIEDASASHGGAAAHDAGILVARRFIGRSQVVKVADLTAVLAAVRS